jgi:23S rRNA G2069 N7-methylase RlmK/C1962 C5-methylase RlmI
VLGVDSSGAALDRARRNGELNELEGKVDFIQVSSQFIPGVEIRGGFGEGGVLRVDSSGAALDLARRNAGLMSWRERWS